MTDDTQTSTTDRVRRTLRGALAASILPAALWAAAGPAGADPGPIQILHANGCGLTATAQGYDELRVMAWTELVGTGIATTTEDTITVEYGDWLLQNTGGDSIVLTVTGFVAGNQMASEDVLVGGCLTDSVLRLDVVESGPAPAGATYGVALSRCDDPGHPLFSTTLAATDPQLDVPVIDGVEYCTQVMQAPTQMSGASWSAPSFTAHPDAPAHAVLTADYLRARVELEKLFEVDGNVVDPASVGVDVTGIGFAWTTRDGNGDVRGTGGCGMNVGVAGLECNTPTLGAGETIEIVETGAPGWQLERSTFGYDDCDIVATPESTECELTLVNLPVADPAPPAEPPVPPAPPAPPADPEPEPEDPAPHGPPPIRTDRVVLGPADPAPSVNVAPEPNAAGPEVEVEAAAEERDALPRTGGDRSMAPVGLVLAVAGSGLIRIGRRLSRR